MAFGNPTSLGTIVGKNSSNLNITANQAVSAGTIVFVYIGTNSPEVLSISDANNNTWYQYGVLGDTQTIQVFYSLNELGIDSGDIISISSIGTPLMVAAALYITGVTSKANLFDPILAIGGATTLPEVTTPNSIRSGINYLSMGIILAIGPIGDTFTADVEYTTNRIGTSGGAATSNVTLNFGYLQSNTATGFTYNPTLGTARSFVGTMIVIQEEAANTLYWVGGQGALANFNDDRWSNSSGGAGGAGIPTGLTDIVFDQNSDSGADFTVSVATVNGFSQNNKIVLPKCKNLIIQNLDRKITFSDGGGSAGISITGNIVLENTTNLSFSGVTNLLSFYLDTDTTSTINTNGFVFDSGSLIFRKDNTGTSTLLNDLNLGSNGSIEMRKGTFDFSNYNVTLRSMNLNANFPKTIKLGSGTCTFTGGGGIWNPFLTTLDKGTSTLLVANTASTVTFNPGKLDYHNIVFGGGGNANSITILDSGRFNNWTSTRTAGYTISCPNNAVFTFTNFSLSGSVGNVITFGQTSADPSPITISKPGPWYVGANSTGSTSTGLIYTAGGGIDYLNFVRVNATSTAITAQGNMIMLFFN